MKNGKNAIVLLLISVMMFSCVRKVYVDTTKEDLKNAYDAFNQEQEKNWNEFKKIHGNPFNELVKSLPKDHFEPLSTVKSDGLFVYNYNRLCPTQCAGANLGGYTDDSNTKSRASSFMP